MSIYVWIPNPTVIEIVIVAAESMENAITRLVSRFSKTYPNIQQMLRDTPPTQSESDDGVIVFSVGTPGGPFGRP